MKLLFDIGNTRLKWAYFCDGEVHSSASADASSLDRDTLHQLFGKSPKPDSIWISNVGSKKVLSELLSWFGDEFGLSPNVIRVTESCCGIRNRYRTQAALGVDRWLAAIGARRVMAEGHLIIIDAGTAVTIDWLSERNNFEGGVILPGFNLMHKALIDNTAGIKADYSESHQIIGRTTEECVNSGVVYGLIGAIEHIVMQMQQEIGMPTKVILTGGSAATIEATSDLDLTVQPELVLLGVASVSQEAS